MADSASDRKDSGLSLSWAFRLLIGARVLSAYYNIISDCDETFNYWEPTHYLLQGTGFQTWEYSPVYAIRSYAYLFLHSLPLPLIGTTNKMMSFTMMRVILALACASSETYFYSAVQRRYGVRISHWLLLMLVPSCGMFISSTAYLPSSFTMYCTMVAMAAWFDGSLKLAIFGTAFGALVGWPFTAILGVPIAVDIVFGKRRFLFFIKWSLISFVSISTPLILIDSKVYGRFVFAPLNILTYNVFGGGGPNLYGTEPWTYYFVNGFLNFNIVFLLALVTWPCIELKRLVGRLTNQQDSNSATCSPSLRPAVWSMLLWIIVFFTRPHKEERFLFPIYPLFCLSAAVCLSVLQDLGPAIVGLLRCPKMIRGRTISAMSWAPSAVLLSHALLSVSRALALYYGYSAPIHLYSSLNSRPILTYASQLGEVNLCVGKEWYRFPSSFFLPQRWKLHFIRSEFRGQLPKQYSSDPSGIPDHMNDMNREEPSRYVDLSLCHFLVDLDLPSSSLLEPRYSLQANHWEVVLAFPYLDSTRSHPLFRALYLPLLSPHYTSYTHYHLLRNKKRRTRQSPPISSHMTSM